MRKCIFTAAFVFVLLIPSAAYAHHVGGAEDAMPADQWVFVDGVAHGVGADGNTELEIAPGDEAGVDTMSGDRNLSVSGSANMNAE